MGLGQKQTVSTKYIYSLSFLPTWVQGVAYLFGNLKPGARKNRKLNLDFWGIADFFDFFRIRH
jgi:hypothetical protein